MRISYDRGSTLPLNAGASALVLLAWSPEDEARQLLETTELRRFTRPPAANSIPTSSASPPHHGPG